MELGDHFSRYGKVLEAKILKDDVGRSKKYGFVSFYYETSVTRVLDERPITFKGKVINVGPAVKKDANENPQSVSPKIVTPPRSPVLDTQSTNAAMAGNLSTNYTPPSLAMHPTMVSLPVLTTQSTMASMPHPTTTIQTHKMPTMAMQVHTMPIPAMPAHPMPMSTMAASTIPSSMPYQMPTQYQHQMHHQAAMPYHVDTPYSFYLASSAGHFTTSNVSSFENQGQNYDYTVYNPLMTSPINYYPNFNCVY